MKRKVFTADNSTMNLSQEDRENIKLNHQKKEQSLKEALQKIDNKLEESPFAIPNGNRGLITSNQVVPSNSKVIVKILRKAMKTASGIIIEDNAVAGRLQNENYYGQILKLGPNAKKENPDIEEGQFVIFSQLTGEHLPTSDFICKAIPATEIVAIGDNIDFFKANFRPTMNRLLVEVDERIVKTKTSVLFAGVDVADPREKQIQFAKVVGFGSQVDDSIKNNIHKNDIIAFDPYCGLIIYEKITTIEGVEGSKFIKTLYDFDVILKLNPNEETA